MVDKYFITRKVIIVIIGIIYGFYTGFNYYSNNLLYSQKSIKKIKLKIKKEEFQIKQNKTEIKNKLQILQKYKYANIEQNNKIKLKKFFNALCVFQAKNSIADCANININNDDRYLNMIDVQINYNSVIDEKKGCLIIKYTINKYLKLKDTKFHSAVDNFNTCSLKFYKPMKKKGK